MKMPKYSAIIGLALFFTAQIGSAAPLGTIPRIDTQYLRLIMDFRSDLWTSPYSYKQSPVRIIGGELRIPLAHGHNWNLSANVEDESLSLSKTEFTLADREVFIGNNLQNQSFGLGYSYVHEDGSAYSLLGAYASASDNPFGDPRDRWFEGNLIYRSALHGNYRWIFLLNQSNNRGLANGHPFPYVGVIFTPNENMTAYLGFPFMRIVWQKKDAWKREAMVTPFGAYFDLEKNLEDDFILHAHTAYTIRSYLYDSRTDDANRLYYQEMSIEGSIRKELTTTTTVAFGVGYAFDRRLYEAKSIYEPRENKMAMDSDMYGRLRVEFNL